MDSFIWIVGWLIALAAIVAGLHALRRDSDGNQGRCPTCDYDLSSLLRIFREALLCPECGCSPGHAVVKRTGRRWRRVFVSVSMAVAFGWFIPKAVTKGPLSLIPSTMKSAVIASLFRREAETAFATTDGGEWQRCMASWRLGALLEELAMAESQSPAEVRAELVGEIVGSPRTVHSLGSSVKIASPAMRRVALQRGSPFSARLSLSLATDSGTLAKSFAPALWRALGEENVVNAKEMLRVTAAADGVSLHRSTEDRVRQWATDVLSNRRLSRQSTIALLELLAELSWPFRREPSLYSLLHDETTAVRRAAVGLVAAPQNGFELYSLQAAVGHSDPVVAAAAQRVLAEAPILFHPGNLDVSIIGAEQGENDLAFHFTVENKTSSLLDIMASDLISLARDAIFMDSCGQRYEITGGSAIGVVPDGWVPIDANASATISAYLGGCLSQKSGAVDQVGDYLALGTTYVRARAADRDGVWIEASLNGRFPLYDATQ